MVQRVRSQQPGLSLVGKDSQTPLRRGIRAFSVENTGIEHMMLVVKLQFRGRFRVGALIASQFTARRFPAAGSPVLYIENIATAATIQTHDIRLDIMPTALGVLQYCAVLLIPPQKNAI